MNQRSIEPAGLHWHGYVRDEDDAEGPDGRTVRLAGADGFLLHDPRAVADWLAEQTSDADLDKLGLFAVWNPARAVWGPLLHSNRSSLVTVFQRQADRAVSVYVVAYLTGRHVEVYAEAVDDAECARHGLSSSTSEGVRT